MYPIHFFESIPSTNTIAKELAQNGAPHGTAVIAANQLEGRGRLGKSWHSVAGKGLYCSIIVRPKLSPQDFPKLTLVAGLGVAQAVESLSGKIPQLKWPNDIFMDGKKCGGILTESSSLNGVENQRFAVIGIGLNLSSSLKDFPEDLRGKITSLYIETELCFDPKEVFSTVRDEILHLIELFSKEGFAPILAAWKRRDFLLGRNMECVGSDGNIISGVSLGPDDEGQLHVEDMNGEIHTVLSGDIRLATREKK